MFVGFPRPTFWANRPAGGSQNTLHRPTEVSWLEAVPTPHRVLLSRWHPAPLLPPVRCLHLWVLTEHERSPRCTYSISSTWPTPSVGYSCTRMWD